MRILVFGASGFIGARLSGRLLEAGHEVIACGRSSARPAGVPASAEWLPCDLTYQAPTVPGGTDAVFYLSQSPHYREFRRHAADVLTVNVLGAVRAMTAAARAGVRFFGYTSTGNVYAPSFEPLREDGPLRRDNGYSLSKATAEESLTLLAGPDGSETGREAGRGGVQLVSFRLFGVFGPGQSGMLVPRIVERVRRGEPVELQPSPRELADRGPAGQDPAGTGGLRISLCYVDDVAACLAGVMEQGCAGRPLPPVLNVGGPRAVSLRELAESAARCLGVAPKFVTGPQPRAFDLVADLGRLHSLVRPRFTGFDEAIARTVEGRAAQPLRQVG